MYRYSSLCVEYWTLQDTHKPTRTQSFAYRAREPVLRAREPVLRAREPLLRRHFPSITMDNN